MTHCAAVYVNRDNIFYAESKVSQNEADPPRRQRVRLNDPDPPPVRRTGCTVPAYCKFESISLQQGVTCELTFSIVVAQREQFAGHRLIARKLNRARRHRSRSSTTSPTRASCLSTTAVTGRPSKGRPSGPRRSSPSSRAIDNTVRGFGRGASPPLASREFKRYFIGRTSRSMMVAFQHRNSGRRNR